MLWKHPALLHPMGTHDEVGVDTRLAVLAAAGDASPFFHQVLGYRCTLMNTASAASK